MSKHEDVKHPHRNKSGDLGELPPSSDLLAEMNYVDRSLAVACTRGREAVVTRFRDILYREDLSEQQWRTLRILVDEGPLTSVEIANLACIHKVSMSRIIKQLEARDFVSRSASSKDGRASYVALTESGRRRIQPLIDDALHVHATIARDFGHERYWQLLGLLRELARIND